MTNVGFRQVLQASSVSGVEKGLPPFTGGTGENFADASGMPASA
jgi:hypothetical protein